MPPAVAVDEGMQIDVSPLLVVDRVILDTNAQEYLQSTDRPFLSPMKEAVHALYEEGFLESVNFRAIADEHALALSQETDRASADPLQWLEHIRYFMKWWHSNQDEIRLGLGSDYDPQTIPIILGIYCHLAQRDGAVNVDEAARIASRIRSNRKRWTNPEKEELRAVIRPYLSYVHLNLALAEVIGHPCLDWQGMADFYKTKYDMTLQTLGTEKRKERAKVAKAQELFSIALPKLRPRSATQMIKLLKDRRIKYLRRMIEDSIDEGIAFSRDWGENALIAAGQAQMRVQELNRLSSWVCLGLSFVPYLGIASGIGGAVTNGVTGHRVQRQFKWLYALLDAARPDASSSKSKSL